MENTPNIYHISHVILRKHKVKKDWRLDVVPREKNNGGKVFVNKLYEGEKPIENPEWQIRMKHDLVPVLVTGDGGIEIATFTEKAGQDRHKHLICTEIYTVIEGTMNIKIGDKEDIELKSGDEIIVLPGTVHEVLKKNRHFLTRVHAVNCHGKSDKYTE